MENKNLINELTQGKELAIQLRTHLQPNHTESCFFLTEMIQSSFEKALLLLNWNSSSSSNISSMVDQEVEEEEFTKNNKRKKISTKDVLKKRKLLPRWTKEVKVCNGTAPEGPLNDGYSWRKYGQKDIHGANFPRCYYRCTHRNVRGCLATKHVQRSDNDPNIFEVTYRGRHTCNQSYNFGLVSVSNDHQNEIPQEPNPISQNPNELWFNFGESQQQCSNVIKTEDFQNALPPFSFPSSSSIGSEIGDGNVFYDGGLYPVAVSPAASDAAWDWSCIDGGGIQRVQSSEQSEIFSATTSVANSPICNGGDWDFSLENVDFDPNFPFDCLDF